MLQLFSMLRLIIYFLYALSPLPKVFVWAQCSRMAREAIKYSTMFGPIAFILSWHCLVTAYDVTRTSITQFSLERETRWRCAISEIYVYSMFISETLFSCQQPQVRLWKRGKWIECCLEQCRVESSVSVWIDRKVVPSSNTDWIRSYLLVFFLSSPA